MWFPHNTLRSLVAIHRALDAFAAAIWHMGVDHGGADIVVPERFWDGPDVIAAFEQVGGEGVAKRVAGCAFGGVSLANCAFERLQQERLVHRPAPYINDTSRRMTRR